MTDAVVPTAELDLQNSAGKNQPADGDTSNEEKVLPEAPNAGGVTTKGTETLKGAEEAGNGIETDNGTEKSNKVDTSTESQQEQVVETDEKKNEGKDSDSFNASGRHERQTNGRGRFSTRGADYRMLKRKNIVSNPNSLPESSDPKEILKQVHLLNSWSLARLC